MLLFKPVLIEFSVVADVVILDVAVGSSSSVMLDVVDDVDTVMSIGVIDVLDVVVTVVMVVPVVDVVIVVVADIVVSER